MKIVFTEMWVIFDRVLRLLTFRQVHRGGVKTGSAALIFLFGLSLVTKTLIDAVWAGNGWYFNEWGIVTLLAEYMTFSGTLLIFHYRSDHVPISRAMAEYAAIAITFNLIVLALGIATIFVEQKYSSLIGSLGAAWKIVIWGIWAWVFVTFWRAGAKLWEHPPRFAGLRFMLAAFMPMLFIPTQPIFSGTNTDWSQHDVWYLARQYILPKKVEEATDSNADGPIVDYEAIIYNQPALVAAAIKTIQPSPKEHSQFYFVGMAPSSAQSVFKKEVTGAKEVFDNRFGTSGYSVALINSFDTAETVPLASNTNLVSVLKSVGKQMDREKDVLVLFITSHGSKELISVSAPGITLNEITPEILLKAFAAAEIKNKVIILSACYSGSFIPALRSNDTLIMTAAGAKKTSFGCSNEREWTYFGDALFNHAFKNTRSMRQAFYEAKDLIKKWETEQNLTPSEPQISMGMNIADVLAKTE
jgi:hypothetical protein